MMRSPPQTRMPTMRSPPMQAPPMQNGPMPGAARFREADNVEPTRFTEAPTHVSYPQSQASWISTNAPPPAQSMHADSFFVPRGASTPAPQSRYGEPSPSFPGGFREDAPQRYEEPQPPFEEHPHDPEEHAPQLPSFEDHPDHFEPVSHLEGDESYRRDPGSYAEDSGFSNVRPSMGYEDHGDETRSANGETVEEEEFIPASFPHSDEEQYDYTPGDAINTSHFSDNTSFQVHDVKPGQYNESFKPKKNFVGGFFSGIRHLPRMWSSSRSGKSLAAEPPASTNPSRPTLPLHLESYSNLPDFSRPSNPILETSADLSRVTETTASSHGEPLTPDQSGVGEGVAVVEDDPDPLPNPYDPSRMPQAQPNIASPEAVILQQAADYDAMTEEPSYDEQADTLGTHIDRVGTFVKDFIHLPWINAKNATVEYRPAESRRAYPKKPGQSWYAKEHHEKLDLLAGPSPPPTQPRAVPRAVPRAAPRMQESPRRQRTAPGQPHRARSPTSSSARSLDAVTAIRPTTTPGSLTTHGGLIRVPSPGASSHGNGQHSYSYAYYGSSPLYVYPAQVGAGAAAAGALDAGGVMHAGYPTALPLAMPPAEGGSPQAVPVFMLAAPPAYGMPRSGSPRKHRRHHSRKKGPASPPPPMPTPFSAPQAAGRPLSLDS